MEEVGPVVLEVLVVLMVLEVLEVGAVPPG